MELSEGAVALKKLIKKAIESHTITRDEYDQMLHIVTKDGHIDNQEKALLAELQDMIDDKLIKFVILKE
jgi:competence protein ComGC